MSVPPSGVREYSIFGGNDGVGLPFNELISLQAAEGLGQHLLGHPADLSLELAGD